MKKILGSLALVALLSQSSVALADTTIDLHETYQSGATFSGLVTFSSNFDELKGVNGVLSGGGYGTDAIDWTWDLGTNQNAVNDDEDGNPATNEDWLMDGTPPNHYSNFIGLSWSAPGGQFALTLTPATQVYYAGVNDRDAAVSYTASVVPESGTLPMMLAGLGALALVRRRVKQG